MKTAWQQQKSGLVIPRPPEFKAVNFRVKATNDAQYQIEGILNAIGNIDDGNDRTMVNAFKKTINDSCSRKSAQHLDFLWPYLWTHNSDEPPIGGIYDAEEVKARGDEPAGLYIKAQLIPDIERARDVYACFKSQQEGNIGSSGLLRQSMGYKAIRYEWVNEEINGQKTAVRNLLEVQVWEGSAVVFPMNELSVVNAVKSSPRSFYMGMDHKTASGKTTWPLAGDDVPWDGGEAHNAIVAKATQEDGSLDTDLMKSVHFWYDESAPEKITSYKLLFCDVISDEIKAVPHGIIACVGGHGLAVADIPDTDVPGVQAKIAVYYKKMNMDVPWEDDDKSMNKPRQRKDFNTVHQAGKASDSLEDWCDLLNDLTETMFQIFGMSDSPESDMQDCLAQFGDALMKEWLPKSMDADLGQYLNDHGYCDASASTWVPYSMQVGSDSYGYMSRRNKPSGKVGRTISANTQNALQQHQDDVKALLTEHKNASDDLAAQWKSMVNDHNKAIQQKVSDLTQLWQDEGQGPAYGNDDDSNDDGKSRVSRREPPRALTREKRTQPPKSTVEDKAIDDLAALFA